jgi:ribonuclease Z
MSNDRFEVIFWGVRGSIPVSGAEFDRYGGDTVCIELRCGGNRMFFDAGSGLREAGLALVADGIADADLFFSHCHYDHIIGLPFFEVMYGPSFNLNIWSGHTGGKMSTKEMVERFVSPPWSPLTANALPATIGFRDFDGGETLTPQRGVTIRTAMLHHPGGAVGYRIEWEGRSTTLLYDVEHVPGSVDPVVLDLMQDADLVVYDCTYAEEEMQRFRGYGHSSWQHGTKLARMAGAKRFALFHHAPSRTDQELDEMERNAQLAFPGAFAARQKQILQI